MIGEVIAGILLGPSLLGWFCQHWLGLATSPLLPPAVAPHLAIIAQLGVILYMFLVGLELNAGLLQVAAHATVAISHASIVVPFLLGVAAGALALSAGSRTSDVPFTSFALFMGVAHVDHGVSGARAHPDRPRHAPTGAGRRRPQPARPSTT